MNEIKIHAISSSGSDLYPIYISVLENGNTTIRCDCPGSSFGGLCKHVKSIITGDNSIRFEEGEDVISGIHKKLFLGKQISEDFRRFSEIEKELESMKRRIKRNYSSEKLRVEGV